MEITDEVTRLERMSSMLKAIAHPQRVVIVGMLGQRKEMTVTEIYEELGIEQAVASQHIAVMRNKEIVVGRRDGKHTFYSLKYPKLAEIIAVVESCQEC